MHVTRRMARHLAWQEQNNPFGKFHARKPSDVLSRAENGDATSFPRSNTDPTDIADQSGSQRRHQAAADTAPLSITSPAVLSRRRADEPGDHIGEVRAEQSPMEETSKGFPQMDKQSVPSYSEKDVKLLNGNQKSDSGYNSQSYGNGEWSKEVKSQSRTSTTTDDNNGKNKPKRKFTAGSQIRATLLNSWINVLLIASPVGIALNYAHVNAKAIFVVNFIAIIPLAAMLSYATEEIALRTGEVIGGLLNASFGNAVELIVSIIALAKNQILIVQTSLIGSMLSNLLLVMGMCFFAGGINRVEQAFNMTVAQTASSLLFLAVSSLLIPTAFDEWANTGTTDRTSSTAPLVPGVTDLSRATAILLLVVYGCYLFFQLKSHADMYNSPSEKNQKRDFTKQKNKFLRIIPGKVRPRSAETSSANNDDNTDNNDNEGAEVEEREEPQLSVWVAVLTLAISTVLVALNAEYLVDAINDITCDGGISKNFVGLILLPIVGNAAEHATAVTVAIKDKMDLAIGVAVGSSMQIALLVLPLVVVLGWIIGKDDMTLYFDGFQIAVLFVAVLLVNYLIQDGKSHWLEGVLLMILYIIIAVAAWFYPTAPGLNDCGAS